MQRVTFAQLLVLFLVQAAPARAQSADPADWTPPDALAFLGVSDFAELQASFDRTLMGRLMKDAAAREAMGEMAAMYKAAEDFQNKLGAALELQPGQLKNPFAGPLALFVTAPPADDPDAFGVTFVGSIGARDVMRDYYDRGLRRLKSVATGHETENVGSYTIDTFRYEPKPAESTDPSEGEAGGELAEEFDPETVFEEQNLTQIFESALAELFTAESLPPRFAACLTEDRLIVGLDPADVKGVLRRQRGGESLTSLDDHKEMRRLFKPMGVLRFFLNIPKLLELGRRFDATGETAKEFSALGLTNVGAWCGHGGVDEKSEFFDSIVFIRGERTGLPKLFSMANALTADAGSLPANAVLAMSFNVNLGEAIDEIEKMVRRNDPADADQMRQSLEAVPMGDGPPLDLRRELFGRLRPPLSLSLGFDRPYGPDSPKVLVSVGHNDQQAIGRLLGRVRETLPPPLTDRDLNGTPIFDTPFGFSFAASSNAICFGSTAAVERAIQPGASDPGLKADSAFRRVAAVSPAECSGLMFVHGRRLLEAGLEMLQHEEAIQASLLTNPASAIAFGVVQSISGSVPKDKIEQARRALQYQGAGLVTWITTPEGIRLTQHQIPADAP